uniref:Uncharacterized protein n=1 Tax=Romanomermis culicivorax TaxID=13658 RepID=A0A915K3F5_ROMCU
MKSKSKEMKDPENKDFIVENGILYYLQSGSRKIIVPRGMANLILQAYHDDPLAEEFFKETNNMILAKWHVNEIR